MQIIDMTLSAEQSYLLFKVATNILAVPSSCIVELSAELTQGMSKFRSTSPYVTGFVDHRNKTLPVLDLRMAFSIKTFAEEVDNIRSFIMARQQDHIDWLDALKASVTTGAPFTKATDPTLCNFGKWYEETRANPRQYEAITGSSTSLRHTFNDFDAPHRRIHAVADKALSLSAKGHIDEATRLIDSAWENDLGAIKRLFTSFVDQFEKAFHPMSIVIETAETRFVLLVDAFLSVTEINASDFQELPAMISDSIRRLAKHAFFVQDTVAIVIDPDYLREFIVEKLVA